MRIWIKRRIYVEDTNSFIPYLHILEYDTIVYEILDYMYILTGSDLLKHLGKWDSGGYSHLNNLQSLQCIVILYTLYHFLQIQKIIQYWVKISNKLCWRVPSISELTVIIQWHRITWFNIFSNSISEYRVGL